MAPEDVLCKNNEDSDSSELSPNEQNGVIESDSNNSVNITANHNNDNSLESENQSSCDENDVLYDAIDHDELVCFWFSI